jgi:hypothetical protein
MARKDVLAGMFSMALVFVFVIFGCSSGPSPQKSSNEVAGTRWGFSVPAGGILYVFENDSTYKVITVGAIKRAETIAALGGIDGTGTYSVEGQTITLRPEGGGYIAVDASGEVAVKGAETFTVIIDNDSFVLDAITYKKVE